ncbi:MAG: choice-of-anchor D domain-containing protein, partial [Thermoguttaceae bacterium]
PGGSAGVPVGISDTSVGPKDVPVTLNFTSLPIVSDLSPTSLGSQTVHVTGTVYGYAAPSVVPTSVDLGNIHPDGAFGSSGVTVSNAVPNSPYYEYLACDGLPDPIAPGGSGVVPVGISDTGVGPHAADVTLNFTSKAYAGTGLSDTPLAPQTVHVTGTVYGYAVPSVPASVDLGNIHPDGAFAPGSITVSNAAPSTGYYENLGCDAVSGPIVPGASAGVTVGISDTSVGPKDVPVTLNFTSLPIASGLSASPLASQTVHVTGTVYGYAVPSSLSTPVDLGNIHVGDSFVPQNVTVANQAPASDYSEPLYANSGAWSTTIPGGSSDSSLLVGISDTTAGPHDVPVTVSFTSKAVASGLSDTDLGSQTLHVIGTVWNYAAPATIASPGSVGKVFRDTAVSRSLSVSNVAPTLYSEGLDASFGAPTGPIYGVGSVSNLGGGLSDSSMTVSLDTSSAGHKDASVLVNLVSNGSNSGLGNTDLGSQTVAMSGDVYDHGVASFDGATKVDALHLVLSGNVHDTVTQSYNLYNLMQTEGYTGALDVVGWDVTGGTAVDPGLSPATIAAGSSQSLTATLDTSVAGTFPLETVTIHLTDSAADGIAGDTEAQTLVLTIDAQVVPEPSTIILLAVALLGVVAYWRRSR